MSFKTVELAVSSAVATNGTLTFSYPTGTNAGSFAKFGHKIWVDKLQKLLSSPSDFTVAFGANIVVTYLGATSIPTSARVNAQFNMLGADDEQSETDFTDNVVEDTSATTLITVNLGSPVASDADGISASQSVTASEEALLNGAIGATLDVSRNVVAAWTGTAVLTVTGTDEYGNVVVEKSASGTSLTGKKAFATITSIVPSANVTGLTVGTGKVLGLPQYLPGAAFVLKEIEDGVVPTAGTIVAGVADAATGTTGDVRGTYAPNSTPNGTKVFELIIASNDPKYKGVDQFTG